MDTYGQCILIEEFVLPNFFNYLLLGHHLTCIFVEEEQQFEDFLPQEKLPVVFYYDTVNYIKLDILNPYNTFDGCFFFLFFFSSLFMRSTNSAGW